MLRDDPDERVAFFRPPSLPGMEVMAVRESRRLWRMFHERYAFCLVGKADAGVRYRGREQLVRNGSLMVREPGETHYNTFAAGPAEFRVLFIDPAVFAEAAVQLGLPATPHFPATSLGADRALCRAMESLCISIEAGEPRLEQQSLFAAFAVAVAGHAERKAPQAEIRNCRRALERAKAHLRARFNESICLDELAAVASLSRYHLVHAFTKDVGIPPRTYQIHVRVERARALLQKGESLADIAGLVGFADQSHFTRHFRRILQVTPGEYAGTVRGQITRAPMACLLPGSPRTGRPSASSSGPRR